MTIPSMIVAGFLLLAAGTTTVDSARHELLAPLRRAMQKHFFRDVEATRDLLGTIAGSVITVTSITFSLLLLAIQQAATLLTSEVYDQFLRRRANQVYFGFFVGLAIYTLTVLATVNPPYNPVVGASLALLLTAIALMLIILLLYTTINQMRYTVVIAAIHDHILAARKRQKEWISGTRGSRQECDGVPILVHAKSHGYLTRLDLDALAEAAADMQGDVEVTFRLSVGSYVAYQDAVAEVRAASTRDSKSVADALERSVCIEQKRDLDDDPAYGIDQLAVIAWTSISTAKSNPAPGLTAIRNLRDVMARWCAEKVEARPAKTAGEGLSVVYTDDVFARLLDAFENLAVVASESMQPQTLAEIVRSFAIMFDRLPADQQQRAEDLIRRSLSTLGDHVLTAELRAAMSELARALDAAGRRVAAEEVRGACKALGESVGKLGSRATRASTRG